MVQSANMESKDAGWDQGTKSQLAMQRNTLPRPSLFSCTFHESEQSSSPPEVRWTTYSNDERMTSIPSQHCERQPTFILFVLAIWVCGNGIMVYVESGMQRTGKIGGKKCISSFSKIPLLFPVLRNDESWLVAILFLSSDNINGVVTSEVPDAH
jgi:hypothetical protein